MILTDGVHIVSDTSMVELHEFARSVGLKRHWFHYGSRHPHYDIFGALAMRAADLGIEFVTSRQLVKRCVRPVKIRAWQQKADLELGGREKQFQDEYLVKPCTEEAE